MPHTVWVAIDRLIDALPSSADTYTLQAQGIAPLAVDRWRRLGRPVPAELLAQERMTHIRMLAMPVMLARMRRAIDGPMLVIKGPEVSACYPQPVLRPYNDLDVLVPEVEPARQSLLASGFTPLDSLGKLTLPGMPLFIELHQDPRWLPGSSPPAAGIWFDHAIPSATGIEGIDTLHPAHQMLLLAVHGWAHSPFRQLRDLIDVASMMDYVDLERAEHLASVWGIGPVWHLTSAAIVELLLGQRALPRYARPLVRHLKEMRDRTNLEVHAARLFGAVVAPSLPTLMRQVTATGRYYAMPGQERSTTPRAYAAKIVYLTRNARARHFDTRRSLHGRTRRPATGSAGPSPVRHGPSHAP